MRRNSTVIIVFLIIVFILVLTFGPFMTIWSLNTLFGLQIVHSFKTYCAVVWLVGVLHGVAFKFVE